MLGAVAAAGVAAGNGWGFQLAWGKSGVVGAEGEGMAAVYADRDRYEAHSWMGGAGAVTFL